MRSVELSLPTACLVLGSILVAVTTAAPASAQSPTTIELFTIHNQRPLGLDRVSKDTEATIRLYLIDGIRQLETDLSRDLPANARRAEKEVLRRLQVLDEDRERRVKDSAQALLRALELGVDRYPAVVFDGTFVAYGTTDLNVALTAYRQWRGRAMP